MKRHWIPDQARNDNTENIRNTLQLIVMRYGVTRIYLITLLVVFSSTIGCTVKYIDTVTIFEIKGVVYNNESQWPIENLAVQFIDTGYDYIRSKEPFLVTIGYSDADGEFTARLNYLWRSKDTNRLNPPQKTFEIILTHEDYEPRRFQFNESDFQQDELRLEINLDKVYLMPRKAVEK
jgi:hypothetical protein